MNTEPFSPEDFLAAAGGVPVERELFDRITDPDIRRRIPNIAAHREHRHTRDVAEPVDINPV